MKEIILLFLKLGFTAFGGPAAHIAMMEREVVTNRKWMTHEHFLDLVGATNLIPGPNSTEMAIHCGYFRRGIPGLIAAGLSFILPAVLLTGILAYIYNKYGTLPELSPFFYGIKPVVIIIIINALYLLGKKALKNFTLGIIALLVLLFNLLGLNEVFSILMGGFLGIVILSDRRSSLKSFLPPLFPVPGVLSLIQNLSIFSVTSYTNLFFVFLKIGSVLFGSGYVLVAYLEGELVNNLGWLTTQQLMDAIAIGQFTPGPVLSTATFIGYQIGGVWGSLLATAGIFIPSFIFVLISNPFIAKLRNSKIASHFLDAVNISSVSIMITAVIHLSLNTFIDWKSVLIGLICFIVQQIFNKVNALWLILGGATAGFFLHLIA